ncbi:hypothetical protein L6R53_00795 [Myxococcota bacterium]|nr:hypothetical protein [Myxococcota bacterium]
MIPVMTRLKIRHPAEGGMPQAAIEEKCDSILRAVWPVLREPNPTLSDVAANRRPAATRRGRRSKAA